jgi:hypothetical protein
VRIAFRDPAKVACEEHHEEVRVGPSEESARDQVKRLAEFILKEVPGGPSRSEGAVDTIIRVVRHLQAWKNSGDHALEELQRLSAFLVENFGPQVRAGEEAVDSAIRLLRGYRCEVEVWRIGAEAKDGMSGPVLGGRIEQPKGRVISGGGALSEGYIEQLYQVFFGATWDGNLINKKHRDELAHEGLIARSRGWNFITGKGVEVLVQLGLVKA